jgi:hypothetical protein
MPGEIDIVNRLIEQVEKVLSNPDLPEDIRQTLEKTLASRKDIKAAGTMHIASN